jgi:hypothetical protein
MGYQNIVRSGDYVGWADFKIGSRGVYCFMNTLRVVVMLDVLWGASCSINEWLTGIMEFTL